MVSRIPSPRRAAVGARAPLRLACTVTWRRHLVKEHELSGPDAHYGLARLTGCHTSVGCFGPFSAEVLLLRTKCDRFVMRLGTRLRQLARQM
jgi:hypothetical protein